VLRAGAAVGDDLFVPLETSMNFVQQEGEQVVVAAPFGAETRLTMRTPSSPADGQQTVGDASQLVPQGARLTLVPGATVDVTMGRHHLSVCLAPPSRRFVAPAIFDALWANIAAVAVSVSALVVAASLLAPPDFKDLNDEFITNTTRFQTLILKPPPKNNALLARMKPPQATPTTQSPSTKKTTKKTTTTTAKTARAKLADRDVVDARLRSLFGDNDGVVSVLGAHGRDSANDSALTAALGGLKADRVASATGGLAIDVHGMGRVRGVLGGGVDATGTLGSGAIFTRGRRDGDDGEATGGLIAKRDYDVSVVAGPEKVIGGLDREIILRVVRAHAGQVRYCYEQALTVSPGLHGKITMRFVVDASGVVSQAAAASDELTNPSVATCLASRVKGWRFPEPRGGGVVVVNYPFVFKQAG
jgi:hypothetical protein